MQDKLSDRVIAIVGFMGSGKTAVARMLAARLSKAMVDLDELISERTRRTPAQIISQDGERAFRLIETELLTELLDQRFTGVVSVGGGAWIEEINRRLLWGSGALTVWIDAPFDLCWQRIELAKEVRPLAPTKDQAGSLFEMRRPTYALAEVAVEARADENPGDLADRVFHLLMEKVGGLPETDGPRLK